MATNLLNGRIGQIMCARRNRGQDPTPTLVDIEQTHVLFVNAHFKPFAAIASEYNRVSVSAATFATVTQFSIPQFGDFFADMVLHCRIGDVATGALTSPNASAQTVDHAGNGLTSIRPAITTAWNGAALAGAEYTVVDAFGNSIGDTPTTYYNMVRYVEYPAEKLFQNVKFTVNGNPLDEYNYQVSMITRKFKLSKDKEVGYKRLVGQEVPYEGYSGPKLCAAADTDYASGVPAASANHGVVGPNAGSQYNEGKTSSTYNQAARGARLSSCTWDYSGALAEGTPVNAPLLPDVGFTTPTFGAEGAPLGNVSRKALKATDGLQTPKYCHQSADLWLPLNFWFNNDFALSIPSVSIPYGQRFIDVTIGAHTQILADFPGAFICQTVTDPIDLSTNPGVDGYTVKNYRPWWQTSTIAAPTISTLEMYINNLFVNPEIHDIFIRRVGFSLIRVYRRHTATINSTGEQQELLSQLKWPIETMMAGLQPSFNNNTANINYWRDWHRLGKTYDQVCDERHYATMSVTAANTAVGASSIGQIVPDTYVIERPVVDTLKLQAHGINIYDTIPQEFFSDYTPFKYGGTNIRTPQDPGAFMVNFALYPGSYQPSSYLNVSRARELYLHWVSNYITSTTQSILIVVAVALNFLLVSDGSAVLRFST